MDPAAALRATPAFVEPPAALGPGARRQVRRAHAGVLLFFVVDGLLLTAYGSIGTVSPHLGWLYALTGCSVSVLMIRWFWQRGATVRDHDRLSLALSLVACLVMSTTSGLAAPVAGLMMMSIMAVMALGAVQLKGSVVIGLCAALPVVELAVLQYTGSAFGIPVGTPSERLLTGLWLAWLMAKCSAHNIAGTELRALVNQANAELAKALHALEIVAATDVLTGLPNRRAIVDELDRALQVRPVGEVLPDDRIGVALLDLDHFKQVNDLHGHDVGDEVLRVFGRLAADSCPDARVGRYGGEEFLLVLTRVRGAQQASEVAERVRRSVASHDWSSVSPHPGFAITVSIGIAIVDRGETGSAAIRRADAALYEAKRGGRDRVVVARTTGLPDEDSAAAGQRRDV